MSNIFLKKYYKLLLIFITHIVCVYIVKLFIFIVLYILNPKKQTNLKIAKVQPISVTNISASLYIRAENWDVL